jgi:hypothetical protein
MSKTTEFYQSKDGKIKKTVPYTRYQKGTAIALKVLTAPKLTLDEETPTQAPPTRQGN